MFSRLWKRTNLINPPKYHYRPQTKFCEGCVFTCVWHSVNRGGGRYPSMHALQVSVHRGMVSQYALQISYPHPWGSWGVWPWGVSRPTPRGEVEGSGLGGSPGPHPGRKLRGLAWVGLQAHTKGGRVSRPIPGVFRPTPRGVSRLTHRVSPGPHLGVGIPACTEADTPSAYGYCCGRYASYWDAFLLGYLFAKDTHRRP